MVQVESINGEFGIQIKATEPGLSINDLDMTEYLERFKSEEGGVLLFRDFKTDVDEFKVFTEKYGKNFRTSMTNMAERASVRSDNTLVTVNLGNYAINFHAEITVPYTPEVLWMFCSKPPSSAGRTGVVDGAKVYQELMPFTVDIFKENGGFLHFENLPKAGWSQFYPGMDSQQLESFLNTLPDVVDASINKEGALSFKFKEMLIQKSKFTHQDVFCCGLLDYPDQILSSNKKEYIQSMISEVTQAVYKHAVWVEWQQGDVLLVDNSRVMHAREAFDCPDRTIFIRYSDLDGEPSEKVMDEALDDENALII